MCALKYTYNIYRVNIRFEQSLLMYISMNLLIWNTITYNNTWLIWW